MSYKLKIEPAVFEKFPDYIAVAIYAYGLDNYADGEYANIVLRQAEAESRANFANQTASENPHVAAWRLAYSGFGSKPSKYLCSVEALLSRVLKGQDLPNINPVVDVYNAVSLRYILPAGGEDLDKLESDLTLKFAVGNEKFVNLQNGEEVVTYPDAGEVIWADTKGVTCRRWNWRQCVRTALTRAASNAYFVLDRLPPFSVQTLEAAADELIVHIKQISPACRVEREILSCLDVATI